MSEAQPAVNAEVIAVFPNKVRISVDDLASFKHAEESLRVGSYLKVSDNENVALMCIIESFSIELREDQDKKTQRVYVIDAYPLGILKDGKFRRGGDELAIPPKKVTPATAKEVGLIFQAAFAEEDRFGFSVLTRHRDIAVPVHGNRFFNKHIAVVGATGSGKSHTIAKILQTAVTAKSSNYKGLNNSHVIIFDIHSEYKTAFPKANVIGVDNLLLPYWLLNGEEMEEMFLESGDNNNYNQESLLRTIVTLSKEGANQKASKVFFDSPLFYDIEHFLNCLSNLTRETKDAENSLHIKTKSEDKNFASEEEKLRWYCEAQREFAATERSKINKGAYADGSIDKFVRRLTSKVRNPRLSFLFGKTAGQVTFEEVLQQFTGYTKAKETNVTILDLSGIPFEVLSITVSLITRILFDYSYYYRRAESQCDTPLLLVYEEAHKYAPRSELARYRSSLTAIERVAKEGRKYGTSLLIASQRPSEISETIFSQCSNFLAMRLTNPDDQAYVRRLLPDTLGNLTAGLPALEAGEALMIGEAAVMPCVVYVTPCKPEPSSSDIPYLELWKQEWHPVDFVKLAKEWRQ
jgi:uncharacterized protein